MIKSSVKKVVRAIQSHRLVAITTAGIIVLVAASGVSFALMRQSDDTLATETSQTAPTTQPDKVSEVAPAQEPTPTQPQEVTSTETPAASTATPSAPKKTTTPATPTPYIPPAPSSQPFSVVSASLGGAQYYCGSGTVIMQIANIYVSSGASTAGGSFTWQLETSGNPSAPAAYASTATIPAGRSITTVSAPFGPGFIYSDPYARDGQSVRVHITSPTNVYSAPFTIPAGTQASC